MRPWLLAAAMLLPLLARADPAPLPQAFDIRMDQKMLATIERALVKLPYEDAAPVLENLSKQIHDQAEAATKPEEKK